MKQIQPLRGTISGRVICRYHLFRDIKLCAAILIFSLYSCAPVLTGYNEHGEIIKVKVQGEIPNCNCDTLLLDDGTLFIIK